MVICGDSVCGFSQISHASPHMAPTETTVTLTGWVQPQPETPTEKTKTWVPGASDRVAVQPWLSRPAETMYYGREKLLNNYVKAFLESKELIIEVLNSLAMYLNNRGGSVDYIFIWRSEASMHWSTSAELHTRLLHMCMFSVVNWSWKPQLGWAMQETISWSK